jgi:hypothetical protein
MNTGNEDKKKVIRIIDEKQMYSVMNDTKWRELQSAVLESLPFPPPFQIKDVLGKEPFPKDFEEDVWYLGDWIEGLNPFYSIEWIRVRPRYLKNIGKLLPQTRIDITEEFKSILLKCSIPFKEDKDTIYIYGYIQDGNSI